ncbi:54S ribosomal protein L17, mitochondrial, partial [Leucoagaricus sp. SymC.cos]
RSPLCRTLATEAQASTTATSSPSPQPAPSKKSPKPRLSTAIILNRSPIITRSPTPFEQAYYAYQARIRRALHQPFPYDFYFKQGSLLETRFNLEEKDREKGAFGSSFAKDDAQDPVKAEADKAAVKLLAEQEGEGQALAPREHPSDKSGDTKSLDRAGERNLYLLLKAKENGKEVWRFPQGGVEKSQLLHQAAQEDLYAECGENMDTWIVSRNPIGVYKPTQFEPSAPEHVVFFYKAHIMAGQVKPAEGIQDFAWLTKQEIEKHVHKAYWQNVKDMLSDF